MPSQRGESRIVSFLGLAFFPPPCLPPAMPLFTRNLSFDELFKTGWPVAGFWLAIVQPECQHVILHSRQTIDNDQTRRWFVEVSMQGGSNERAVFTFEIVGLLANGQFQWPPEAAHKVRDPHKTFSMQDVERECTLQLPLPRTSACLASTLASQIPSKQDSPALAVLFRKETLCTLLLHQTCPNCKLPFGSVARKFWVPGFGQWMCFECLVTWNWAIKKPAAAQCAVADCSTQRGLIDIVAWAPHAIPNMTLSAPIFLCRNHKQAAKSHLKLHYALPATVLDSKKNVFLCLPIVCELYASWIESGKRTDASDAAALLLISKRCSWFLSAVTWSFFHYVTTKNIASFAQASPPWTDPTFLDHMRSIFPNPPQSTEESLDELHIMLERMSADHARVLLLIPKEDPYKVDRETQLQLDLDAERQRTAQLEEERDRLKKDVAEMKSLEAPRAAELNAARPERQPGKRRMNPSMRLTAVQQPKRTKRQ